MLPLAGRRYSLRCHSRSCILPQCPPCPYCASKIDYADQNEARLEIPQHHKGARDEDDSRPSVDGGPKKASRLCAGAIQVVEAKNGCDHSKEPCPCVGWGIEEEDTLVYQLQQRLNQPQTGTRFEVWNAGVPGYATWHELAYLVEAGEVFDPDLILVAFLFNDVDGNNEAVHKQPLGMGSVAKAFMLLTRKSAFLCFLRNTSLSFRLRYLQPYQGPNCWDETETLLDGLVEQSRKLGSALAVVAFPMRLQVEPDAEPGYYDRALGENPQENYQDVTTRLCHERGIAYLDLLSPFQDAMTQEQGTLFLNPDHPNARGHHVAAEAIYQLLATFLDGVRK